MGLESEEVMYARFARQGHLKLRVLEQGLLHFLENLARCGLIFYVVLAVFETS